MSPRSSLLPVLLVASASLAACAQASRTDATAPPSSYAMPPVARPSARRVSGPEARSLVRDGALLVDVRTPAEFARDAVQGAINVPYDQIEARAVELGAKDRPVVVYCHSGRRSGIAAATLVRLGFAAVYDLGPRTAWP